MPHNMRSVMVFNPKDSNEETTNKFIGWLRNNNQISNVPNATETRKYLDSLELR